MQQQSDHTRNRPGVNALLGRRYRLDRRIAVGGMGEVWAATDTTLGRTVAVKLLRDELVHPPDLRQRFRAEARHAAGLAHPGIASVYDYQEDDDTAFLVMELVPGEPLSTILARRTRLPVETTLSILAQTAEALHAAHAAGVIHRDVKPGNLMVNDDGSVKVTDFGIARAAGAEPITQTGQVVGTAQYMSPEQAEGGEVTATSDVYSLGVVGYEMLAGRPPFWADTPVALALAHIRESPPPLPADVPPRVRALIDRALAKDSRHRFRSAAAFAGAARRELLATMPPPGEPAVGGATVDATAPTTVMSPGDPTAMMPASGPGLAAPQLHIAPAAQVRRRRRFAPLLTMVTVLAAGTVVALLAAGRDAVDLNPLDAPVTTVAAPPASTVAVTVSPTIPLVTVDAAALIGTKVGEATDNLKALGFEVATEKVDSEEPKDMVVSVEPAGDQPSGATITLFVSSGDDNRGPGNGKGKDKDD